VSEEDVKPEDGSYIFADIPVGTKQAVAATAEARVRQTTKSALQWYLDQFFQSDGRYRDILDWTAPFMVSFVTDLTGNSELDDTMFYEIQLARIWSDLREKLPAIIIADTGFTYQQSGLGGQIRGVRINDRQVSSAAPMLATVELDLMTASTDESTTSDLADALTYILGPLTSMVKGWWIYSGRPEDNWEVRLPQVGAAPSGLERRNVGEDTRDSIWTATLTLSVEFEGIVQFGRDCNLHVDTRNAIQNINVPPTPSDPSLIGEGPMDAAFTDYDAPEAVYLGKPHPLTITSMPYFGKFVSDDSRVAIVDDYNVIHPKRLGKFNLMLLDMRPDGKEPGKGYRQLFSTSVSVKP